MSNVNLQDKITLLQDVVGDSYVYVSEDILEQHAKDYTEDLRFMPEVVVKPGSVEELSAIMKLCFKHQWVITPRGAGTGLCGGALPVEGGIVLGMERFNKIIEVDENNLQATVESGVINAHFRETVEAKGLFYPPDPASMGSCFLGGNIAHSSGGPRAVKYGTTKDFVLNLEVVLPNGEIIWTGANTLKNSTGYNLTQLMVGSEGSLGIVTKIVFKLLALPQKRSLMLAFFDDAAQACLAVSEIMKSGVTPSAMELMERKGVDIAVKATDTPLPMPEQTKALLLIEVDGNNEDVLMDQAMVVNEYLEKHQALEVQMAQSEAHKDNWWKIRRSIGEVVKQHSVYKEEDTVVQRAHLAELLSGVKAIGEKYGFESVCYGHAGDGNLHVNILKGEMSDAEWNGEKLETGIREIFKLCKKLGGTISGEHGIGYVQKKYLNEVFEPMHFELMKGIKKAFDPQGILNPGKWV